ncbi:MAG: transcriptional repressor [Rikenellaceae bacterium]|nr:transcriptional repressor [Rikenellaceae bacterium]
MNTTGSIKEIFVAHGIRHSVQRLAIMDYLFANRTHPEAEEIFAALAPSIPTLSRMTVYNTLHLLADVGAIRSLDVDGKARRFDADTSPHGHFVCNTCGCVEDVPLPVDLLACKPSEHEIKSVQVVYRGVCKNCLAAETEHNL